jgi:hypothetical protein
MSAIADDRRLVLDNLKKHFGSPRKTLVTSVSQYTSKQKGEVTNDARVTVLIGDDDSFASISELGQFKQSSVNQSFQSSAFVQNPKYSFQLHAKPQTGKWVLDQTTMKADGKSDLPITFDQIYSAHDFSIDIDGSPIHKLLEGISYSDSMYEEVNGSKCIRLSTAINASNKTAEITMFFDIASNRIMRFVKNVRGNTSIFTQADYSYSSDQNDPIKKYNVARTTKFILSDKSTYELFDSYDFVISPGIDEARLRLTAFDLPEPEGVVWEKPTPYYIYLLSGAAILTLVAIISRWLLSRR